MNGNFPMLGMQRACLDSLRVEYDPFLPYRAVLEMLLAAATRHFVMLRREVEQESIDSLLCLSAPTVGTEARRGTLRGQAGPSRASRFIDDEAEEDNGVGEETDDDSDSGSSDQLGVTNSSRKRVRPRIDLISSDDSDADYEAARRPSKKARAGEAKRTASRRGGVRGTAPRAGRGRGAGKSGTRV